MLLTYSRRSSFVFLRQGSISVHSKIVRSIRCCSLIPGLLSFNPGALNEDSFGGCYYKGEVQVESSRVQNHNHHDKPRGYANWLSCHNEHLVQLQTDWTGAITVSFFSFYLSVLNKEVSTLMISSCQHCSIHAHSTEKNHQEQHDSRLTVSLLGRVSLIDTSILFDCSLVTGV